MKFAIDGALNGREINKKISLYSLLEDIFYKKELIEEANKHGQLIEAIKNRENHDNIEKDLRKLWVNLKFQNQKRITGVVDKIFPHGKSGFIKLDNHTSYYFNTNEFENDSKKISEGMLVSFFLEDSFDECPPKLIFNFLSKKFLGANFTYFFIFL